jgi:hypothetical protein
VCVRSSVKTVNHISALLQQLSADLNSPAV